MEEQQVDEEVIAVDVEVNLPADKREAGTEFAKCFDDAVHEGLLEVAFGDLIGQVKEIENVRVLRELPGEIGIRGGKASVKIGRS